MMQRVSGLVMPVLATERENKYFHLTKLVFAFAGMFLWTNVLYAPLRYELALLHMELLIYLPKLLLLMVVITLPFLRPRASQVTLVMTGLALIYLLWGIVNLQTPVQAFFGLWIITPFLFGLWAGPVVKLDQWRRLFLMLFVVVAAGVFLNPFVHYPWSGQIVSLLGKDIVESRQWTTFGVKRFAGLSAASYTAATQLLLFSVMLIVVLKHRSVKLVVWAATGAGIALTTTKGALGAWLLVTIYFAGGRLLRWPKYWIQFWIGVLALIFLAMILMPLSTLLIHYDPSFHGYISKFLFASFGDRLNWMWPDSFRLLDLSGAWHWWTGRGLGGIGAAQHYFEPEHYLSADNLFVYITVLFGLPLSLCLFGALYLRILRLCLRKDYNTWRFPVFMVILLYGIVVNDIEGSVLSFFLGLSLSTIGEKSVDRWAKEGINGNDKEL